MANTIKTNLHLQVMGCCVCGESAEIPRKLLQDQHALLEKVDDMGEDHRQCRAYRDNPHMARLSRQFGKGIRREERQAAQQQLSRA